MSLSEPLSQGRGRCVDDEPSAWLLELGAAARRREFRSGSDSSKGSRLFSWGSRRAGARTRRRIIEQALISAEMPTGELEPVVLEPVASPPAAEVAKLEVEDHDVLPPLLERIGAYTIGSTPALS